MGGIVLAIPWTGSPNKIDNMYMFEIGDVIQVRHSVYSFTSACVFNGTTYKYVKFHGGEKFIYGGLYPKWDTEHVLYGIDGVEYILNYNLLFKFERIDV